MTSPLDACLRRSANLRWGVAMLALAAGPALSQPTGNPKGTMAPPAQGDAAKPPATRAEQPSDDAKKPQAGARTNPGSRAARSGNLRSPGVGTAGGLTGRHPGEGASNRTTETNQAPPAKPSKP
jgi:hypothetical protein